MTTICPLHTRLLAYYERMPFSYFSPWAPVHFPTPQAGFMSPEGWLCNSQPAQGLKYKNTLKSYIRLGEVFFKCSDGCWWADTPLHLVPTLLGCFWPTGCAKTPPFHSLMEETDSWFLHRNSLTKLYQNLAPKFCVRVGRLAGAAQATARGWCERDDRHQGGRQTFPIESMPPPPLPFPFSPAKTFAQFHTFRDAIASAPDRPDSCYAITVPEDNLAPTVSSNARFYLADSAKSASFSES